jgi:acyl-coenzyme A thioesterase PaaI-like protein
MSAFDFTEMPGWVVDEPEAHADLADAARGLIAGIRRANAPENILKRAAALAAEAADLLIPYRENGMPMQGARSRDNTGPQGLAGTNPSEFFPFSPVVGPLNAISPLAHFEFDGERLHGTANLGATYNGPPGMVHGGIIALVFDELLGATNVCHGLGGFTGTLSVRYEKPTFIDTELVLEGWIDRVEGRKVFTHGTISIDGGVTARAEGIFIQTATMQRRDES